MTKVQKQKGRWKTKIEAAFYTKYWVPLTNHHRVGSKSANIKNKLRTIPISE